MTVKVNPWIVGIGLVAIALIIFSMIRGCNNASTLSKEKKQFVINLDSINKKRLLDSAIASAKEQEYKNTIELQNGQIALWQNRFFSNEDSLKSASDRIDLLKKNHAALLATLSIKDTSSLYVPGEYVNQCEECFGELNKDKCLVFAYKMSADSFAQALKNKTKIDSARIQELSAHNANLNLSLIKAITTGKKMAESIRPGGKLLLSLSTLLIKANYPNAVGIGFGYQDNHNRMFAIKYFGGEYGSVKQVDLFMPLSFKKIK